MILPREKIPSNSYFIIFILLTSISIISDIFSIIISKYKGQISCSVIAIIFRLIFVFSYIITLKYEFEAIIIFHLIINNCLFFYSAIFVIYLNIFHKSNFSDIFILFCYILYYTSIACNFINIIILYVKYYKVYASMSEDDRKYLKIYNKRASSVSELELVEKKE